MSDVVSATDRIEKRVVLKAPVARVWRALTDSQEFGTWFRVHLEGPFVERQRVQGHITFPGYEHLKFEALVVRMDVGKYFAYRWHPYAIDSTLDYSSEPTTLVEFHLEPAGADTRLTVVESGFDQIPAGRRAEAFRMNDGGWAQQLQHIQAHVASA